MTSWEVWATGVLAGVNAPLNPATADVLWAWSGSESLPRDRMSWCNPLDSTLYLPGAVAMNNIGTDRHVWAYASVQDGITATVDTLLNGYYPVILSNLRNSVPRPKWGNACVNLGLWGTGCGWLGTDYGPVPDNFGDDMSDYDPNTMPNFHAVFKQLSQYGFDSNAKLDAINTTLAGLPAAIAKALVVPPPVIDVKALAAAIVAALPPQGGFSPADELLLKGLVSDVAEIRLRVDKDLAP